MGSPTATELLGLSTTARGLPDAEARSQPTFLPLAPATSASYPTRPKSSTASPPKSLTSSPKIDAITQPEAVAASAQSAELVDSPPKHHRSSSLASTASTTSIGSGGRPRFLKLGPVHWGEGASDWSEVGVTE